MKGPGLHAATLLILMVLFLWCIDAELKNDIEMTWSKDHANIVDEGSTLELKLDRSSGSAFRSKDKYLFGSISMDIKLVPGESAGTITSFYMQSLSKTNYYELDFEFLGNTSGEPYVAQTNVYAGGNGGREQRIYLWFDPTVDFHTYSILWNKKHIVFYVDSIPIRIFVNKQDLGVPYPSSGPMRMYSSIWNGEDWATRGGLTKTSWAHSPFIASFRNFTAKACALPEDSSPDSCLKSNLLDEEKYNTVDASKLSWVRRKYLIYDYCTDSIRYTNVPPECT